MSNELNDLVWSKMGGYPFWPSFISPEPGTGLISKGSGSKLVHHVTFLGDNSRGWVPTACVREFRAEDTGPDRNQDYRCKKKWEADHTMAMKMGLDLLLEKAGVVKSWQGKLVDRGKAQESPQHVDMLEIEEEIPRDLGKQEMIEKCDTNIFIPTGESSKTKIKQEIASTNDCIDDKRTDSKLNAQSSDSSSNDESFIKEHDNTKMEDEELLGEKKRSSFKSVNKEMISKLVKPSRSDPVLDSPKGLQYKSSNNLPGKQKFAIKVLGIEKLEAKKGDTELKEGRENKNVVEMKKDLKDEKRKKKNSGNSKEESKNKFLVAENILDITTENKYDIIKKRKHKSSHKDMVEVKKVKQSIDKKYHKSKTRNEKCSHTKTDEILQVKQEEVKKRTNEGCGECKSCLANNCGNCQFCLDSPSFGGPGVLTSLVICSQRICSIRAIVLLGIKNEMKHHEKSDSSDTNDNENSIKNQMSASIYSKDDKKIMHDKTGSGDENNNDDLPSEKMPFKRKRRSMKGCECDGCISQNCGDCIYCLDMPAFGGMGIKRQRCKKRQCLVKGKGFQAKQKGDSVENEAKHYWKKYDSNIKHEKKSSIHNDLGNNGETNDDLSCDFPTSSKISYSKVKDTQIYEKLKILKATKSKRQPKSGRVLKNPLSHLTSGESSDFSELEDFSASQFSSLLLDQKMAKAEKRKEELKPEKHKRRTQSEKSVLKRDKNRNKISKVHSVIDSERKAEDESPRRSFPASDDINSAKNSVKSHQCVSKYCRVLFTCPQNTWVGETSNKYLKNGVVKPSLTPIYHAVPPRCHLPVLEDDEEGISLIPTDNDDSDQEAPLGTYKIPKTKTESIPTSQISPDNVIQMNTETSPDNVILMNTEEKSDNVILMNTEKKSDNVILMKAEKSPDNVIKMNTETSPDNVIQMNTEKKSDNVILMNTEGKSDNVILMKAEKSSDNVIQMNTEGNSEVLESSDNVMQTSTEKIVENPMEEKLSERLNIFSGLSLIQEYDDLSESSDLNSSLETENIAKEHPSSPKTDKTINILAENTDEQEKSAIKRSDGFDSPKKKRSSRWDVPPPTHLTLEEIDNSNAGGIQYNQSAEINIPSECWQYNLPKIPPPDPVNDKSKSSSYGNQIKKESSSGYKSSSYKQDDKKASEKRLKKSEPGLDGWDKYNSWGNRSASGLKYKYQYGPLPQYDVSKGVLDKLPQKNIFDSHCHLDLIFNKLHHPGKISQGYLNHQIQKFGEFQSIFPDEIHDKFEGCITNFCDPKLWNIIGSPVLLNTLEKEPGIFYTLGCHPHFAEKMLNKNCLSKLESLLKWGKGGRCVALGECGLDLSKSKASLEIQKKAFKFQLELAMKLDLPLALHIRDAEQHAISVMRQAGVPANYPIHRHCFNDSWLACQQWMKAFPCSYIGLTNLVTYNRAKNVHEIASLIPLDRLILETDAPYFPPRLGSKFPPEVSHPGHVIHAAAQVAQLRDISLDTVLAANRKNVARLYKIKAKKIPRINE